jgi:group I intron endonuclease
MNIPFNRQHIFKKSGIYVIKNTVNDRVYVGSSNNLYKRFNAHKNCLLKENHPNKALTNFCLVYGINKLYVDVIEFCETENLIERENYYIVKYSGYGHGFNCCPKAESSFKDVKVSDETKLKLSVARKKYILENQIENNKRLDKGRVILKKMFSDGLLQGNNKGKIASEETRLKQRLAKLGKPSNMTDVQIKERIESLKEINSGSKSHFAKLKEFDVLEIRKLLKEGVVSRKEISQKFNISQPTICDIDKRRSWNHLI